MKNNEKLKNTAKKICGKGQCYCDFTCGHSNRVDNGLKRYGTLTECPLAKYNITPVEEHKLDVKTLFKDAVTTEDISHLCSACEHKKTMEIDGVEYIDFDMSTCIDCPVFACMEAIHELDAEGRIS